MMTLNFKLSSFRKFFSKISSTILSGMDLLSSVAFCLEIDIDKLRKIRKELVEHVKEHHVADVILDFSGHVPVEATKQLTLYLIQHGRWHENIERCIDAFFGAHICRLH